MILRWRERALEMTAEEGRLRRLRTDVHSQRHILVCTALRRRRAKSPVITSMDKSMFRAIYASYISLFDTVVLVCATEGTDTVLSSPKISESSLETIRRSLNIRDADIADR
jgi:hypothetical protein